MDSQKLKKSFNQTRIGFKTNIPILLGVLLLIAIVQQYVPLSSVAEIKNGFFSSILVTAIGSISTGSPVNSYLIAKEFGPVTTEGFLIASFLVAWVTVGIIQIPAESFYFGKRYAIIRNILAFLFSFVAGFLIYILYISF